MSDGQSGFEKAINVGTNLGNELVNNVVQDPNIRQELNRQIGKIGQTMSNWRNQRQQKQMSQPPPQAAQMSNPNKKKPGFWKNLWGNVTKWGGKALGFLMPKTGALVSNYGESYLNKINQ